MAGKHISEANNATLIALSNKLGTIANVRHYGAIGDGLTDDTTAMQNAINYCISNKKILFIPSGTYKITTTLSIVGAIYMIGEGRLNSIIKSTGITLFSQGVDTNLYGHIFLDLGFTNEGGSSSILFDISFTAGIIERCGSTWWNIVFNRSCKGVTKILSNRFYAIKNFFLSNNGNFTDVQISHNYISGYQPANPICFGPCNMANVTISHNYIDFFKYFMFADRDNYAGCYYISITLVNNTIEYVWRALYGTIKSTVITSNRFQNIDASTITAHFTNPDAEMTGGTPYAIYSTGFRAMTKLNIANNMFACNGIYLSAVIDSMDIRNNYYSTPSMNYGVFAKRLNGTINDEIFIDFLHRTTEESLPTGLWCNLNGSYLGREIIYQNKIARFIPLTEGGGGTGEWRDYLGNILT